MEKSCESCIHFGYLKDRSGYILHPICMAPITTEPPESGTVSVKHNFVYVTSKDWECELYTPHDKQHEQG